MDEFRRSRGYLGGEQHLKTTKLRMIAAAASLLAAAAVAGAAGLHKWDGQSSTPAAHLLLSPGDGLIGQMGIPQGKHAIYGVQQIANFDHHPVTLLGLTPVDPTPGFHVDRIAVVVDRPGGGNEIGTIASRTIDPHALPGYVLAPERPASAVGVQLVVEFHLAPTTHRQGFRGLKLVYRFRGHLHWAIIGSSLTACSVAPGASVSQTLADCAPIFRSARGAAG